MSQIESRTIISKSQKISVQNKIESLIDDIQTLFNTCELELKAQKKKAEKYPDLEVKSKILKILKKKVKIIICMDEGKEYSEDKILNEKMDNEIGEINERKKEIKEEWDGRLVEQEKMLDEIHKGVKDLKQEAYEAEKNLDDMQKGIHKLDKHIDSTEPEVREKSKKIADLIKKIH